MVGNEDGPAGALASTCSDTVASTVAVLSLTWSCEPAEPSALEGSPARTMAA